MMENIDGGLHPAVDGQSLDEMRWDSKTENLLSCAPSCSEACLFFFDDLLSLWLQSIQEDS